jgi:hypothetical protein
LRKLGRGLTNVGSFLDRRELSEIRRAVLRERARERRSLLVEVVLGLLVSSSTSG